MSALRDAATAAQSVSIQLEAGERLVIGRWKERYRAEADYSLSRYESDHWLMLRYLARTGRLEGER